MKSNEEYLDELLRSLETEGQDEAVEEKLQEDEEEDVNIEENNTEFELESGNPLEQLMAEIEPEDIGIDFDGDEPFMSEESIDSLLNAAKASGQSMRSMDENETADLDLSVNEDFSDIHDLFDEDDEHIEDNFEEEIPIGNEQEFSMEDLDSLLEDRTEEPGKGKEKKKKSKDENLGSREEGLDKPKTFIAKFVDLLFEEEPDVIEPAEMGDLNLSEENKEILTDLDRESKKKKKAKGKNKKAAKGKKGEEESDENSVKKKAKKTPKPKKEKKVKPPKEVVPEKPEKMVPKKKIIVTSIFAASILVAILLLEFLVIPLFTLTEARGFYSQGEYNEAYQEFYGEKLSEEDTERFQTSRAVMRMQTNLDRYHNYLQLGDEVKALHSLIEGVHVKEDVYALATTYNATAEVEVVYMEILGLLSSKYGITEEAAVEIINEKSDLVYTRKLEAIVNGTEYVESDLGAISQEDMLPEEAELFQGNVE